MSLYNNCDILLTTKHKKNDVIAPIFAKELSANIITCELDTDVLGTFSGEIPRTLSAVEAAEKKCLWGLETANFCYGLASEGSFGPHPNIQLIPCNREILCFIDLKLDIKIYEHVISTNTNYKMKAINSIEELFDFAQSAQYPSHGLIIRPNINNGSTIYKGITNDSLLLEAFEKSLHCSDDKKVWIETDMRADMNPTRMSVIRELTRNMVTRLKSLCNDCKSPGWGLSKVETGLECEQCGFVTSMVKYEIFSCVKCAAEHKVPRTDGILYANPGNCDNCNP